MALWLRRLRNMADNYFVRRRSSGFSSSSLLHRASQVSPTAAALINKTQTGRIQPPCIGNSATSRRFVSAKAAGEHCNSANFDDDEDDDDDDSNQMRRRVPSMMMDHLGGGRIAVTPEMRFISESSEKRVPCYCVLDDQGYPLPGSKFKQMSKEMAVKIYHSMVRLQVMDTIFYETQRQGRIPFYLTSHGEEAVNIASAAALTPDDVVLAQYREHGVLLWRGFSMQEFANQCFGNDGDYGKGRQMPIHYGSKNHNYFTISSPIGTQLPQAAGVAYSLKMDGKDACAATFFGDGATSEGDFHAGLNFAAVLEAPVVFICRNNGYAISTPTSDQFRSDGIVIKGQAYGIRSIRVDGNDALAVYSAVNAARHIAITEHRPVLVEALTYRVGHHSTSDDSTKYRPVDEIENWKTGRSPLVRFRKWVQRNGWLDEEEDEYQLCDRIRKEILAAIQVAEKREKPPISDLFTDVYDHQPPNLHEQEIQLREAVKRHPQDYPSDVSL